MDKAIFIQTVQFVVISSVPILSFFAKVFEILLYKYFTDINDILYKHKFGFRDKHSTQQAIITLVKQITESSYKY